MKKLFLCNLGCSKNFVDGDTIAGFLVQNGFEITQDSTEASAIIVNTCSFIEQATQEARLTEIGARLEAAERRLPEAEAVHRAVEENAQQAARELAALEARLKTLTQLQAKVDAEGRLPDWLKKYGLSEAMPLWRRLQVEPGWEPAVEAVFRERLNTIPAAPGEVRAEDWERDRPGQKVTLALLAEGGAAAAAPSPEDLLDKVRTPDAAWSQLLADWLADVRIAGSLAEALQRREVLPPGGLLVTQQGDLVGRYSVSLFAPDQNAAHGVLERQREIETLEAELVRHRAQLEDIRALRAANEADWQGLRTEIQTLRREQQEAQQGLHAVQVETLKHTQALERHREQSARARAQLADLESEAENERGRKTQAEAAAGEFRGRLETLREQERAARDHLETAERAVRHEREQLAVIERELREAEFSRRECEGKLTENAAGLALAERQLQRIAEGLSECQSLSGEAPPEVFEAELQGALETRREAETALSEKRDALEAATQALRDLEEVRMRVEQGLEPLRNGIGDLRLKEQAAAMNADQLSEQLVEAGADEEALQPLLASARPQALGQEINRLQKAIADLGAVNLAALEELGTARERKGYLDEQAADLMEAMETLETAIRRIDRETRDLLRHTFDTVNGHFGQLFPELFGGGRAELVMTGEEILDAGVQVVAQPPGKRNVSIHLLSGGEKALTAIALVFSMFQLNPAPFCLLDEVDAPLDDTNTERFCRMVKKMSEQTQFLFISHNKIAMEMAGQLVGVTMQESGVSRVVEVDMETALNIRE